MVPQQCSVLATQNQTGELRLIRLPAVQQKTGMGRSWIYAKVAAGEFPQPVQVGGKAVAWIDSEVDAWITARIAAARQTA